MIRYRLLAPLRPGNRPDPRLRQVQVSLDSDYSDVQAPIQLKGLSGACREVREALRSASGARGEPLGDITIPEELAVAMASPSLRPYQPELIEGQEVLRRRPPQGTSEQIADRVATQLARLLVDYLPASDDVASYPGRIIAGSAAELVFLWGHWRPTQPDRERGAATLAPRLGAAARVCAAKREERYLPDQTRLLLPVISEPDQVHALTLALIETLDGAPKDPDDLVAALRARMAGLGLMPARDRPDPTET